MDLLTPLQEARSTAGPARLAPDASQHYQVEVQTQLVLGNWTSANTATWHLRQTPAPLHPAAGRCSVAVLAVAQTNPHGLHALAADVAQLRQELLLDTDATGALVRVANAAEVQARFAAAEPFLRKKYRDSELVTPALLAAVGQTLADGEQLARVLADAPEYALLFPDVGGLPLAAQPSPHRPRRLPRVLGNLDVVLCTDAWTVPAPPGVGRVVCVAGRPDPAHVEPDEFRQAVRALTGQYDAAADLAVQHVERYEWGAAGGLSSAARYTTAAIAGVFFSSTVATLVAAPPPAVTPAA